MSKKFTVSANGTAFGQYEADDEQGARDACARDAGYDSEAQMVETLERNSELVASEIVTITADEENAAAKLGAPFQMFGAVRRNIFTDSESWATAKRIGNGNASLGIRLALAAWQGEGK